MSEEIALAIADLETAKELWSALAAVTQENQNLRALLGVLRQRNAHAERVVQAARAYRQAVTELNGISTAEQALLAALAAYDDAVTATGNRVDLPHYNAVK
jgi:hypothetical protein